MLFMAILIQLGCNCVPAIVSVIVIVAAAIVIVRSLFLRRRGAAASAQTTMDLFTIKAVFSSEMSWFGREGGHKKAEYSSH